MKKCRSAVCFLLCFCLLFLSGCGPSLAWQRGKKQGLYPETKDFPNTKWVCRELDLYFCMFANGERKMIGEYVNEGKSYRVVAEIGLYDCLTIDLISTTNVSPSEHLGEPLVSCETVTHCEIHTHYIYQNNSIICTVSGYEPEVGESIPETLTFDCVGTIAAQPSERWYCLERDMYLDAFSDVNGYYRGEIAIDGKRVLLQACEIGNSGYFVFSIANGITNNYREGTTHPITYMYLEISEEQIIAKVSDDTFAPGSSDRWDNQATLTFVKTPPASSTNAQ